MSYKVLYRKYRPKRFEEVAGQKAIVQTLSNAIKNNKISHAYLFTGPRGTGKTTMAKIFAKAINCEKGNGLICDECDNCKSANNGTHPDIIEIDAASNNGVEDVRSIIERVKYSPLKGKYKVYIIDEVHMMSSGAFNALLKTLEEPPSHVIFILATTEPHKVLPTILSRCQRYDFAKIDENDIANYLMTVLEKENIEYDAKAIAPIVELADGGMRDALMMLDQVLSYANKKITEKDTLALFGIASMQEKVNLLIDIANKNINNVLTRTNTFLEGGIDIKRLIISLIDILKDLLIYLTTKEIDLLKTLKGNNINQLASMLDVKQINEMIDILLKAESDFKYASNPRSLFEITLLKLSTTNEQPSAKVEKTTKEDKEPITIIKKELVKQPVLNEKNVKEEKPVEIEDKNITPISIEGDSYVLNDNTIIKIMVNGDKNERLSLISKWRSFLEPLVNNAKLSKYAILLLDSAPYVVSKNVLIITYDYDRLSKKANIKSNQKNISQIISTLLKRHVFVYALSRGEEVRLRKLFFDLRQINNLPKKEEVIIKED